MLSIQKEVFKHFVDITSISIYDGLKLKTVCKKCVLQI